MSIIICLLLFFLANLYLYTKFPLRTNIQHKHYDVCIVLGSPTKEDGKLSRIQKSRMDCAIQVFKEHKVDFILISGSAVCNFYIEAEVMKQYAIHKGIPDACVLCEVQAKNTYENLKYTKEICDKRAFHKVMVVTSSFHARRASFFVHKFFQDYVMVKTLEKEKLKHTIKEYFCLWNTLRYEYWIIQRNKKHR